MEDWLGIVLGILFILGPALLEKGNRKKKRGQRHERQLPQQEEVYRDMNGSCRSRRRCMGRSRFCGLR